MTYEQKCKDWVKENTFFIYEKKCSNCEKEVESRFKNEFVNRLLYQCDKNFTFTTNLGNKIQIHFSVKRNKELRERWLGYYKTNSPNRGDYNRIGTKKVVKFLKTFVIKYCTVKVD